MDAAILLCYAWHSQRNDQRQPSPHRTAVLGCACVSWRLADATDAAQPPRMDRHACRMCGFELCASVEVHSLGLGECAARDLAFSIPARYESRTPTRALGRI